jgi:hypothetical protein
MKRRFSTTALVGAFVVASPVLTFAGGQPAVVHMQNSKELGGTVGQNRPTDERATGAKAPAQNAEKPSPKAPGTPNLSDSAFHK